MAGRVSALLIALGSATALGAPSLDPRVRLLARGLLAAPQFGGAGALPLTARIRGGAAALDAAGLTARPLSPSVAALEISEADLPRLLALPGLLAVEPRRRLRPLIDVSVPLVGAKAARESLALDGTGVLIAVIDTGLDLRHRDFRRRDGRTRVRWLLDAASPRGALHPELPDYGGMAVYSAADIDAALAAEEAGTEPPLPLVQIDQTGHGTHVAGIAAGGGLATGRGLPAGRYVGMAPGAELCVVQAGRALRGADFRDDDVLLGVRFCLDRAQEERRPIVVNLSLGGLGGPHDGSTALEQALDELFPQGGPGRALVVAAGNAGSRDWHAGGFLDGGSATVGLRLGRSGGRTRAASQVELEVYWRGTLRLSVVSPRGVTVGPVGPGESQRGEAEGEGRVTLDAEGAEGGAGRRGAVLIAGVREDQAPAAGEWRLVLEGTARRWDVWFADGSDDLTLRLVGHLQADVQIGLPATARSAISVGSFTSRIEWARQDGLVTRREREELLAPSLFSAAGPTADGRFAPDLSAPGEFIAAALSEKALLSDPRSSFHYPQDPLYLSVAGGAHAVLRGTSQAAPHVAGAAALLFQAEPTLSAARLRELLRVSAEGPGYGPRAGFGRLDVLRAAHLLRGARAGALDGPRSQLGVSRDLLLPEEGEAVVTVVPRDRDGLPLGKGLPVVIEATAGTFTGPVRDLGSGRYERTLRAGPRGAVALVTASLHGVTLGRGAQVAFALGREELGAPAGPGGCAAVGGRGRSPDALAHALASVLGALLRALGALWASRGRTGRDSSRAGS